MRASRTSPRAAVCLAALTSVAPAAAEPASALGAGQVLQVFVGLGIVLALIALAAWASRRLNTFRPQGANHIRVLEGLSLGAREKLLLVQVDGTRVLLGMSPGRIQALHAFPAEQRAARFDEVLADAGSATDGSPRAASDAAA